jgi:hypothetical protein
MLSGKVSETEDKLMSKKKENEDLAKELKMLSDLFEPE